MTIEIYSSPPSSPSFEEAYGITIDRRMFLTSSVACPLQPRVTSV